MEKNIRINKSAEIRKDHKEVGEPGEELFAEIIKHFFSLITGSDESFIIRNPNAILAESIAYQHKKHDFLINYPVFNAGEVHRVDEVKVEVKTRSPGHLGNVIIETWKPAYADQRGRYHEAIDGWYYTSEANWFVFIHMEQDRMKAEATCIRAEDLRRCVESGLKEKRYRETLIRGDRCICVPVADLWKNGGYPSYTGKEESREPVDSLLAKISNHQDNSTVSITDLLGAYADRNPDLQGLYIHQSNTSSVFAADPI